MPTLVEACVDSVESAIAAERAGAARVELCDNLNDGGTTPSAGMIAACKEALGIPVFVIVRPRGGDFVASDAEVDVMRRDIAVARSIGVDGVVVGVLRPDGTIDRERTAVLRGDAGTMAMTFHRAFDACADSAASLEQLVEIGIDRVLTSGGARTALDGAEAIGELVHQAAGRIAIMAGGGIRKSNAAEIVKRSGVSEVHVRPTRLVESGATFRNPAIRFRKPLPEDESSRDDLDADHLAAIVDLMAGRA